MAVQKWTISISMTMNPISGTERMFGLQVPTKYRNNLISRVAE